MDKVGKQELVDDFRRVAQELGKRPTLTEYNDHGEYSSTPIYKRFDSFEDLKDEAGFETGQYEIARENLIEDLQRVAHKVGRTPPVEVYDEHGEHNSKTLKRRFGSWNKVLYEAELEPTDHSCHWNDNEPEQFDKDYHKTVSVSCLRCGETTQKRPNQIERFDNAYCSPECQYAVLTEQTGKDARSWEGGKVEVSCEICGDTRKVRPSKVDKTRFCSQDCMFEWRAEYLSGEDHPRWKGGYNRYYGPNWYKQRDKTLERDNYECQTCPVDQEAHQEKYDCNPVVHHIIRFGDFDSYKEANRLENLITLCKQCHGLVECGLKELPKNHC